MQKLTNVAYIKTISAICCAGRELTRHWENFKAHFAQAFKETKRSSRTSRTKGYVAHVHAAQANTEIFTEMQQDHTLALANLATATQAYKTLLALLKRRFQSYPAKSRYSGQNSLHRRPRSFGWKNQDSNQPQPGMDIRRAATWPHWILTQVKIENYILEADRGLTLIGTAPPMDTKWRSCTHWRHAFFQAMATTSQIRD